MMIRFPGKGDVLVFTDFQNQETTDIVVVDVDHVKRTFSFVNREDINLANPQISVATFEFAQDHCTLVGYGKVKVFTFVSFEECVRGIENV